MPTKTSGHLYLIIICFVFVYTIMIRYLLKMLSKGTV